LTARYLLKETVQLHEGDTVLYHAAAGGVGQIFTWAILPHYNNTPEALAASSADLFDAIESGILKVDPTNIYRFDQLIHAHQQLEQRRTVGATVLHV
jgi:NADPH:quinone reductase